MKSFKIALLTFACILSFIYISPGAGAEEQSTPADENGSIEIKEWLVLGPVSTPFPVFNEENKEEAEETFLLSYDFIPAGELKPEAGKKIIFPVGEEFSWKAEKTGNKGIDLPTGPGNPETAYLASYIELQRWTKLQFKTKGTLPYKVMIDGKEIIESRDGQTEDYKKGTVNLKRGKHTIIVKTVRAPADTIPLWYFSAFLETPYPQSDNLNLSLTPVRNITISDILDSPHIDNVRLSPEGDLAALKISRFISRDGDRETGLEIRKTESGELVRTIICGEGTGGFQWAPDGKSLSYTVSDKKKTSIRLIDIESGDNKIIAEKIMRFESYKWDPNGEFIIYSASEKTENNDDGVKRLLGIYDRTGFGRHRSFLYLLSVNNGTRRKITTGKHTSRLADIHPGGEKILVTRNYEELSERPYNKTELVLVNLKEEKRDLLWEGRWFNNAVWSPDGNKILISAGPSAFGEIGKNVPENTIPNDYDSQLYIFNHKTGDIKAVTKEFKPAVRRAYWSAADNMIYIVAEDKSLVGLFKYSPRHGTFKKLSTGCDVISSGDIAREKAIAVFAGMSADEHQMLYRIDLERNRTKEIYDPADSEYKNIRKTGVEEWNFTSNTGTEIIGRVHYPPDFNSERRYPCIVYYYGGTSPVSRSFGGRYPKNLWASKGYIVYVLQPAGATGFGQEFSTAHVNDWGRVVSDQIIEGTKRFLKAHPFVDPTRVGCIGASYGGFMTELLVTETDIFAAAISHAGISSISSYWGEGYWGYAYNAVSAAESFPWNNREIYIDQSPLFSADKITTPLLLLHGESDTNVPTGESEQMYTALKLLGKEVEYIRFAGQNHFILDYQKRIKWSDAILAWFDKWLKEQPQWWNNMYPPVGGKDKKSAKGETEPVKLGLKIVEDKDWGTFLAGEITIEDIRKNIPEWDTEYYEYEPDMSLVYELAEALTGDIGITCVLGTWCPDSRRMVPRLWKVLELAGYPLSKIRMLAVTSSRAKENNNITGEMLSWSDSVKKSYGIEAVATVILMEKDKEIGRIVETVQESIERDLLDLLED